MKNMKNMKFAYMTAAVVICVTLAACTSFGNDLSGVTTFDARNIDIETVTAQASSESEEQSDKAINPKTVAYEGTFDDIMGYSGTYKYTEKFHFLQGYYKAEDGRIIADVFGVTPEYVDIVDLDGDGVTELISEVMFGDGALNVCVYRKIGDIIYVAGCNQLLQADDVDPMAPANSTCAEYIKETHQVKISYMKIDQKEGEWPSVVYDIDYDKMDFHVYNPELICENITKENEKYIFTLGIRNISSDKLESNIYLSEYQQNIMFGYDGYMFKCDDYTEPLHGETVTFAPARYSLGGVGIKRDYRKEDGILVFENGQLTEVNELGNHQGRGEGEPFTYDKMSGVMYMYDFDMYWLGEASASDTPDTSKYWVVFFTYGESEPVYMEFFNADYYTGDDALNCVKYRTFFD